MKIYLNPDQGLADWLMRRKQNEKQIIERVLE